MLVLRNFNYSLDLLNKYSGFGWLDGVFAGVGRATLICFLSLVNGLFLTSVSDCFHELGFLLWPRCACTLTTMYFEVRCGTEDWIVFSYSFFKNFIMIPWYIKRL